MNSLIFVLQLPFRCWRSKRPRWALTQACPWQPHLTTWILATTKTTSPIATTSPRCRREEVVQVSATRGRRKWTLRHLVVCTRLTITSMWSIRVPVRTRTTIIRRPSQSSASSTATPTAGSPGSTGVEEETAGAGPSSPRRRGRNDSSSARDSGRKPQDAVSESRGRGIRKRTGD